MRKSDLGRQLTAVSFQCTTPHCGWTWTGEPSRVVDEPEREHHPWRYFAQCEVCHAETEQAPWERSLLKAWTMATGPKTPEGKAAVAGNLEGAQTPEVTRRTRFNAMKHGMAAKTATFFPSKPDGYSFCSSCKVEREWCRVQPACVKQTEIFLLHHAAFENRDPKVLLGIYSTLQAGLYAVLQQILQTIIADGVELVTPEWVADKDGNINLVSYIDDKTGEKITIMEAKAHPLFKPFGELLSRTGLSLADMGMTVKVVEQEEETLGRLESDRQKQEGMETFQRRAMGVIEGLRDKMERATSAASRDPVLIEHQNAGGS